MGGFSGMAMSALLESRSEIARNGCVQICTWSTGWMLGRLIDPKVARILNLRAPENELAIFLLFDSAGILIYEIAINPKGIPDGTRDDIVKKLLSRASNGFIHLHPFRDMHGSSSRQDPDAAPELPNAKARQICISAIVEALGIPILASGNIHLTSLFVPLFLEEVASALEEEKQILFNPAQRAQQRWYEWSNPRFRDDPIRKQQIRASREEYVKTASRHFDWSLNLHRFDHLVEQISIKEHAIDAVRLTGSIHDSSYQLVLHLDFTPTPLWSVTAEQEFSTHDKRGAIEVLSSDQHGPIQALVSAGIIAPLLEIPSDPDAISRVRAEKSAEVWLDRVLADAPDLEEAFDLEGYRLLEAPLPLFLPLTAFLQWVKAQP